jgi:excinuclease UvrABC nuclease subunit
MTANELFEASLEVESLKQGSEELGALPTVKGVVLFADEEDRPIQLLITGNIRRLIQCKLFGGGEDISTKRTNIAEITQRIYYRCCYNDFACSFEHWQIARVLWPDTYRQLTLSAKNSYVRIDLSSKWPRFVLTDKPIISETIKIFGPFPTRKSANAFIEILQEAFGLCRKWKIFESEARAISCPYLQMGQCSGPCAGKVSQAEYFRQVTRALAAANGNTKDQETILKNRMHSLCIQMKFEQAESVKKQLDKLEQLNKKTYCWTGDLAKLVILHIDKSAKIAEPGKRKKTQSFSAFLIWYGSIERPADFTLDNIEDFHKTFLSELVQDHTSTDPEIACDQMGLVGHFLYRSRQPGIWIDCAPDKPQPSAVKIMDAICKHFELECKSKEDAG